MDLNVGGGEASEILISGCNETSEQFVSVQLQYRPAVLASTFLFVGTKFKTCSLVPCVGDHRPESPHLAHQCHSLPSTVFDCGSPCLGGLVFQLK